MNKRQKYLLGFMIIMVLVVVIDNSSISFNSDYLNGDDIKKAKSTLKQSSNKLQKEQLRASQMKLMLASEKVAKSKIWFYEGSTSPRSLVQQEIRKYLEEAGLNELTVNVGKEKKLPEFNHLRVIDFPVSGNMNKSQVKDLNAFFKKLEMSGKIYHWTSFQISQSRSSKGNVGSMRLNGVVRTYIINPEDEEKQS